MKTRDQHNDQKIGVFLIPGFIISSFFSGCYTIKIPPPSFSGVVREKDSGALLSDVRVDLQKTGVGTTYVPTGWSTTTGAVGYFELPLAKLLTYGTKSVF
ncbi:MAG: hypothetical protein IPP33_15005 [Flavobacteriales bacterium]|nr:hypothetical protein [Flavobacteriales bacterium]